MKLQHWLNIFSLGFTLVLNSLANALPLNGRTTGEISDSFPVLFTPAGYVFSIWGLIYLLLTAFTVYQALPAGRNNPRIERTGYWITAANLFNGIWILFWHYGFFPLTMLTMLALLISLIVIYLRLGVGVTPATTVEKLVVHLPFSVYLGWISVATIANASVLLYDLGWNGAPLGPEPWTVLMILIAAGLGIAMIVVRREVAYPLVLLWAFVGINVRQAPFPVVATIALISAGLLGLVILVRLLAPIFKPARLAA